MRFLKKTFMTILVLGLLAGGAYSAYLYRARWLGFLDLIPQPSTVDQGLFLSKMSPEDRGLYVTTVAKGLKEPQKVAFMPDDGVLVAERDGTLKKLGDDGFEISVPGVYRGGGGGLLGMALHPDFASNHYIYFFLTGLTDGGARNRVDRYKLEGDGLTGRTTIVQNIPAGAGRDGGRIAFGPDRLLYVSTGDGGTPGGAQDRSSLAGKILRLNPDGTIPSDNPYGSAIYAYGFGDPQGLAWDSLGRLWVTDFGHSGPLTGSDELNLVKKGGNYGWPLALDGKDEAGLEKPFFESGRWETWAPSGEAAAYGKIWFAGLRGRSLYEAPVPDVNDARRAVTGNFEGDFGRLRDVVLGPDESLYLLTANTGSLGMQKPGDDKLIRIDKQVFKP